MPKRTTPARGATRKTAATAPTTTTTTAVSARQATPAAAAAVASCNCGPLEPLPGENPVPAGTSGDAILSQIQLECDDETGVFFFRFQRRLYLRVVKSA